MIFEKMNLHNPHSRDMNGEASSGSHSSQSGLPSPADLLTLVLYYLDLQRKLWQDQNGHEWMQEELGVSAERLAADFVRYHGEGKPDLPLQVSRDFKIGCAYVRFSDENNNARSLIQQLHNILVRAKADNVWIPWNRVFADAAISGRTSARPGFQLTKTTVCSFTDSTAIFYVDDLSRLSRDTVDSLEFGKQINQYQKRLIGVSDGFDSASKMAPITHSITALQNEMFSQGLAEKVHRGMRDAFYQDRNVAFLPFGYVSEQVLDEHGRSVVKQNDKVEKKVRIVPEQAAIVIRMFELYTDEQKSPAQIAKLFNEEKAGNLTTWNPTSIRQRLANVRYRGDIVFKATKTIRHPETGKKKAIERPREEQMTRHDESMRIISEDLWLRTQARIKAVSMTFGATVENQIAGACKSKSRQSIYPTRLFDLYCGYCQTPLRKNRSDGKTSSMICAAGQNLQHGCKLKSSKTLGIIDECLLAHIKEHVLSDDGLDQLVTDANRYLDYLSSQPLPSVEEIERKLDASQEQLNRLADRIAQIPDGLTADRLQANAFKLEAEILTLQDARKAALALNTAVEPIPRDFAQMALADLRTLLHEDVVEAHKVLARSVGKVEMTIGEKVGRSNIWIASFKLNMIPLLIEISTRRKIPTTQTLELLSMRSWNRPVDITCKIFEVKREVRIAHRAAEANREGKSLMSIARQLQTDTKTVTAAIEFATKYPHDAKRLASAEMRQQYADAKYRQLAPQVSALLDAGMTPVEIAKEIRVSLSVVNRAIDHIRPEAVEAAFNSGGSIKRNDRTILPKEIYEEIRERLQRGESGHQIAREMRVDRSTVYRQRKLMESDQGNDAT